MRTLQITVRDRPPRRIPLRELASVILLARHAHVLLTHAQRDRCTTHYVEGMSCLAIATRSLPKRYQNTEWYRVRVVAPGDRAYLRMLHEDAEA